MSKNATENVEEICNIVRTLGYQTSIENGEVFLTEDFDTDMDEEPGDAASETRMRINEALEPYRLALTDIGEDNDTVWGVVRDVDWWKK